MRKQMPETVKVGPHVYSVARKAPQGHNGECDANTLQISVRARLRRSKAQETILHELIHACVPANFENRRLTEEEFVAAVSPILLQLIQDNPELITYLTEK